MTSVINRPTTRSRDETSLSFFSFLFAEIVSLSHEGHLEDRLHALGVSVGERCLPIMHLRDRPFRRETSATSCLQFVANSVWRQLFGHPAEVQATDRQQEFYLVDRQMVLNRFISVSPEAAKEGTMINCASFAAGIVEGMMRLAGFSRTSVEAVFTHSGSMQVLEDPAHVTFVVLLDGRSKS